MARPRTIRTARSVTVLDQSIDVLQAAIANPSAPRAFGNEVMAGGGGRDLLFAGAGDDVVQGDGNITLNDGNLGAAPVGTLIRPTDDQSYNTRVISLATDFQIPPAIPLAGDLPAGLSSLFTVRFVVGDTPTDADDYIEGNAGNDRVYGNGGSDDIVGGDAIGYANQGPAIRTDGADLIYGGSDNQTLMARNYDNLNALHATDADAILGDNGAIYRIVTPGGRGRRNWRQLRQSGVRRL